MRHFRDVPPEAILLAWYGKKTKPSSTKARAFTKRNRCATTRNYANKLKPGLVALYDIRPGNGAGLFSKEKTKEEISQEN